MLPAWSEPRATSAIADIRGFIGKVLDRGYAYEAGGAVYFDVSKWDTFGSISGYDEATMLEYAAETAAAIPTTRTSATRSTSSCGSPRPTTSRRGSPCGVRDARAGTSSARPWRCGNWAPRSISTAAVAI